MLVVDVDSHWEVAKFERGHHPFEQWRDRFPKIVQHLANGLSGDLLRALPDDRRPDGATLLAPLVHASDERGERVTMQPPHPSSPAERLAWMDEIGIDHCLVNPGTWWQLLEYLGPDRPQGAAICNDWLAEQIADGGHRLHGVAVVDFTDLGAAVAELKRARDKGHRAFFLYTLDGRTTIKDRQTKQLTLMAAHGVAVTKQLVYYGAQDYYRTSYGVPMSNQKVGVYLELRNSRDHGLGAPLPKGKIRVYKADASGSQQLVGEDWIEHTPKDERVKIKMGEAFDVVGERTQKEWRKLGAGLYEVAWEITLRNHKTTDQTVTVIEPVPGDWQVLNASHAWDKPQAHTLRFTVPVPKESAATLVYRVRLRF